MKQAFQNTNWCLYCSIPLCLTPDGTISIEALAMEIVRESSLD